MLKPSPFPILLLLLPFTTALAEPSLSAQIRNSGAGSNSALQKELVVLGGRDQKYRMQMISLVKEGLANPDTRREVEELGKKQKQIDRDNMNRLAVIIREYGWPGLSLVGEEGSNVAFLILQHAELAEQKRYFPLLKDASDNHEAAPADAAMLEDRILMSEGAKQLYGTALTTNEEWELELWPIEDEENVDLRRAEVGLPPLADYLKMFGVEYAPTGKK